MRAPKKRTKYASAEEAELAKRAQIDAWQIKNKERAEYNRANSRLKREFGITLDDYNKMFEQQDGCCAICGTHQSELPRALAVDHCHTTLINRGLLCMPCNLMIGHAKDNINILKSAINYLK